MSSTKFPEVQGGGSLILAWQVRNKHVLVIGGGEVAAGRILNCLNANAIVTCVSPSKSLNAEVQHRIDQNQITHIDRTFEPCDLGPDPSSSASSASSEPSPTPVPSLVLCAVDDPVASSQIWKLCKERRIPANIADVPSECDFYFGSVHRDGPLQVMVSTNGNGPRMAAIVRRWIARNLPGNVGEAVGKVGALRRKLRVIAPAPGEGDKRMKWISKVCEKWSLEDLCEMEEKDMEELLRFYKPNTVPTLEEIRLEKEPGVAEFDGSFGWWI